MSDRKDGPERGDIAWLHFDPHAGHERAGTRPALVVSPGSYNRRVGIALFCPVTSRVKGYPIEVVLPSGLKVQGAILSDQLKNLDWRVRRAKYGCSVPAEVLDKAVGKILALLDPEEAR